MKPLSTYLNPEIIEELKEKISDGFFSEITLTNAMQFILTDGILPKSNLPATAFIKLENWLHSAGETKPLSYSATELKNKTGEILEQVLRGHSVRLLKHGRAIAEIKPIR